METITTTLKTLLPILLVITLTLLIWSLGVMVAKRISSYEVITPEKDIHCIVVSRMFNTSVDCWSVEERIK